MVAIFRAVVVEGYITKDITTRLGFLCNTSFGKTSQKMATNGG